MVIRKATLKDSESIATCLFLAMEDLVYRFIGQKDHYRAREFLLYFIKKKHNQYSYQNCWVAEDEHEIIAAANVYDGAKLSELREPVIQYVKAQFIKGFNPEDETRAGEYYIDLLGVNPNQQGKGIGSKMLRFLIDEYVSQHKQTLGLLVDEENPHAKRLYLKLGFKPIGRKVLVGKQMEHLQITG